MSALAVHLHPSALSQVFLVHVRNSLHEMVKARSEVFLVPPPKVSNRGDEDGPRNTGGKPPLLRIVELGVGGAVPKDGGVGVRHDIVPVSRLRYLEFS